MTTSASIEPQALDRGRWLPVIAMALGVFTLIGSEILPTSMLTDIAADFGISAGAAGQTVTVTAVAALATSLLAPSLTARLGRKAVIVGCSALLLASNVVVALSESYGALLAGRVGLGMAVGAFWAMSAAVTVRLVPASQGPKAMSIVFSGMALASVTAAPLGAWLGEIAGWRSVFWGAAILSALVLGMQVATLPALPPTSTPRLKTLAQVFARRGIALAIAAAMALYVTHVAYQTYLRPTLEAAGAGPGSVSLGFAMLGLGGLVGTALAGIAMRRSLRLTVTLGPVAVGLAGIALAIAPADILAQSALIFVWGIAYGAVPVAWSLWLTRAVPDQRETASGLFVAAVQVAIAAGAAVGGLIYDARGSGALYIAGGVLVILMSGAVYRIVTDDGVRDRSAHAEVRVGSHG
jgi:predicted MFS family arabinose efflux permease